MVAAERLPFDEGGHALRPDPARCGLRFHVADHEIRGANVVARQLPRGFVAYTLRIDVNGPELRLLSMGVDRIDDTARAGGERANVEMVSRRAREADQLALVGTSTMKATSGHGSPRCRSHYA